MEVGYVLAAANKLGGFYLGQRPMTIGWIPGPPFKGGARDQRRSELLAPVGYQIPAANPRFPAERCRKCSLTVFSYATPVYDGDSPPGAP
jgi:hypothetical protein